jgi:hypothetical protein
VKNTVRVYVNERPVEVDDTSTAIDAVRAWSSETADQVTAGDRALTDSRGLPLAADAPIRVGAIIRVVSGRQNVDRSAEV